MNSIDAMEAEIALQLQELPLIELQELDGSCILVGAGDSYAACLAAQYTSSNRALSCYPLDVVNDPTLARGRTVYLVSVSGKTKANLLAARVAKSNGIRTVAVTANPTSPLAVSCDKVIQLNYAHSGLTTAGTISFGASLTTCLSIAGGIPRPKNLPALFELAEEQASSCPANTKAETGSYFILGDGALYPIAMYGAMKLNEVVGASAIAYPIEGFCHSPLFGLGKNDIVLILGRGDEDNSLTKRLDDDGFMAMFIEIPDKEIAARLFHAMFFAQKLALKVAQKNGGMIVTFLRIRPC
jgi:fructoselysine-6-P-deglycase FrlB-like protein